MSRNKVKKIGAQKKVSLAAAIILSIALLAGGAFAWTDFGQSFINRFRGGSDNDVLLHDDFEPGINKDVYVENTGENPLIVRVMFNEYFQIGNDPVIGGNPNDKSTWKTHLFNQEGNPEDCGLETHKYFEWVMSGGTKVYKPGTGEAGNETYTLGQVFADGSKAKETLGANSPITMEEYISNKALYDSEENGRWILDSDGWAYWSKLLQPGEATNLLLDNVITIEKPDDNYFYAIDVILQASNKTESYKLLTDKKGEKSVTDEAEDFINSISPSKPSPALTISNIQVTTPPTKIDYIEGETFDKGGMVVTATMSDGTKQVITDYTITPNILNTVGNEIPVTISAGDKSVVITVKVTGKTPEKLNLLQTETSTSINVLVINDRWEPELEIDEQGEYSLSGILENPNANTIVNILKITATTEGNQYSITLDTDQYLGDITVENGMLITKIRPTYETFRDLLGAWDLLDDIRFNVVVTFEQDGKVSDQFIVHQDISGSMISEGIG